MPNRIIRDSCKTSPSLDALSPEAERFFWRLVTVADDFGRFEADPRILLAKTFPLRVDRLKPRHVGRWRDELVKHKIIECYESGEHLYAFFLNWAKYQDTRAKSSKYPSPPASASRCAQMIADVPVSESESETTRTENREPPRSPELAESNGHFARFWDAYPRRVGKGAAEKAYAKATKGRPDLHAPILVAVEIQRASPQWTKDGGQFVPYPATWLNQRRWEDGAQVADPEPEDQEAVIAKLRAQWRARTGTGDDVPS